jgi:isopentenyl-diphosphate delta-isomerase
MTDPAANDLLILVDSNDNEIGTAGKLDAHRRGLKHRAISALIKNAAGEFLLHRRNFAKYHSGGLWTNACCSHPAPGESAADAAKRRLFQEMGITCALEPMFVFDYRADVPGGLIEHEIVHVFGGRHDGAVKPDPDEVSEWKWIGFDELVADMQARPEAYTVWFRRYVAARGGLISAWLSR